MKKKDPTRLWNLTDLANYWSLSRSMSHKYFNEDRIDPPTHYRGNENFWIEPLPEKPVKKKLGRKKK